MLTHLGFVQAIIARMAGNAANCKTWCVTIVSAVTVVAAEKGNQNMLYACVLPVIVFAFLDGYYLTMERSFRISYSGFVARLNAGEATSEELFRLAPSNQRLELHGLGAAILSASVFPVYATMLVMLAFVASFITSR